MALIGLVVKNNDTEAVKTKIGKITPALARLFYAISFVKRTGIINGYYGISGAGTECDIIGTSITYSGGYVRFKFNKGAFSVCGACGVIEQGTDFKVGSTLGIPVGSNTSTGSMGIKVDLSQPAGSEVSFYYKNSGSLTHDNLLNNETDGIYEFELYKYTISSGVITFTSKTSELIIGLDTLCDNMLDGTFQPKIAQSIKIVSTAPTASPEVGTLIIAVLSSLPATRYDRVLYIIT